MKDKFLIKIFLKRLPFLGLIILAILLAFKFLIISEKKQKEVLDDRYLLEKTATPSSLISLQNFTLGFAGEIILARDVAAKIKQVNDYKYPFYNVASLINKADLFFATLEAPLYKENSPCGKGCMRFVGDEKAIEGLRFSGIDIVSLAANHIMDGGEEALKRTREILQENEILFLGAGLTQKEIKTPVIKEIKNTRLGFLAYNEIYPKKNTNTTEELFKEVQNLKKAVDLVIVSFHWGIEYTEKPTKAQIDLAYQAIDAGADLIIGDHPHWIQSVEFYKDKPIFYSVGNFVFDQMWSRKTKEGIMVFIDYEGKNIKKIKLIPFLIENYCQPTILNEEDAEEIIARILEVSDKNSSEKLKELMR